MSAASEAGTQSSKVEVSQGTSTETLPIDLAKQERDRLALLLFQRIPFMASDYKTLIKHTGGLLSASMGYAYTKGLNDALKLLLKGEK